MEVRGGDQQLVPEVLGFESWAVISITSPFQLLFY